MILASSSPRRIEMFRNAGYDPVVMPASIIESVPYEMDPPATTMFLAFKKAMAIYEQRPDETIISADTVVVMDGEIIGKPRDKDHAYAILSALRGRSHHVITGCCVIRPDETADGTALKHCFYEDTEVWFKDYTDEELLAYIDTDEPYDKAGGYAIQETFGQYIDHIDGDVDNVIGLPFARVVEYI